MNWEKCIICCDGGGDLKCPADSLQGNGIDIYVNFLTNVHDFRAVGDMPVDVECYDVDAKVLLENRAKWHKSCRLKFAQAKIGSQSTKAQI